MLQSPLAQTLGALNLRERQELRHWVLSPAFNRRPEVVQLYDWLCERLDQPGPETGSAKAVAREHLSADESGLRHTMSFLFRVVKQYLAWREWSADPLATRLSLCRALRKKGLAGVFDKEFKQIPTPDAAAPQHAGLHLQRYQMHFEQWEAQHRTGQTDITQLSAANEAFGLFVALKALRHGCAALDQPGLLPPEQVAWLPESLAAVEAGRYAGAAAVQAYFRCFKLMQTGEEYHFQPLKALLAGQGDLLPPDELRDVYLVAINFCIKKLNTGARRYIREALDLYRSGLERQVIQDNGVLAKATYQNILLLAIAVEEWDWARDFLEQYRGALPSGERHNAYHFNLALYYFRKKDYPAAQDILRRVEFRDVFHNLDARRMLVRIYFDTGAVQALDSLLHSFKIYLQRHRNIGYHRELNSNFVRAVQQLLRLEPGDATAREKLRQRVSAEGYVAEREWLLQQLEK
ncbi:MAG: hypothetical protein IT260_24170 [Saprospiraceae bacterium]|nr:hypothetical protein [Saprospiraceae bacterium]